MTSNLASQEGSDDARIPVHFFVSYAHADHMLAEQLLEALKRELEASATYRYFLWSDAMLEVGSKWHDEIQNAAEASEFGLLLVSPSFLTSPYIVRSELPKFLSKEKSRASRSV